MALSKEQPRTIRSRFGAARHRTREGSAQPRAGRLYIEHKDAWEIGAAYTVERVSRRRHILRRVADPGAAQTSRIYHVTRRRRGDRLLPVIERIERDFTPGAAVLIHIYEDRIEIIETDEHVLRLPDGSVRRRLMQRRVVVLDSFEDREALRKAAAYLRRRLLEDRRFVLGDTFAGCGGTHLGFVQEGFTVRWAVDWDRHASALYRLNFPETEHFQMDIRAFSPPADTRIDGLLGTFPCDDFSQLGAGAGLTGSQSGLFGEIIRIAAECAPRHFIFLENVANLVRTNGGQDREAIREALARQGYPYYHDKILPALGWVPQLRQRYVAVAFAHDVPFRFPDPPGVPTRVGDILEPPEAVPASYDWTPAMVREFTENRRNRHSLPMIATRESPYAATLTENGYKGNQGSLILREADGRIRKFTQRETARYMGFPDSYILPPSLSWSRATQIFGNSVVVPMIRAVARSIREALCTWLADRLAHRLLTRPVLTVPAAAAFA